MTPFKNGIHWLLVASALLLGGCGGTESGKEKPNGKETRPSPARSDERRPPVLVGFKFCDCGSQLDTRSCDNCGPITAGADNCYGCGNSTGCS